MSMGMGLFNLRVGIGALVGGAVGFVLLGPWGAAAGAAIGGAVGHRTAKAPVAMTPAQRTLLMSSLTTIKTPSELKKIAGGLESDGFKEEGAYLRKRAELRRQPAGQQAALQIAFRRAMASENPAQIEAIANAFMAVGASATAKTLRDHANAVRAARVAFARRPQQAADGGDDDDDAPDGGDGDGGDTDDDTTTGAADAPSYTEVAEADGGDGGDASAEGGDGGDGGGGSANGSGGGGSAEGGSAAAGAGISATVVTPIAQAKPAKSQWTPQQIAQASAQRATASARATRVAATKLKPPPPEFRQEAARPPPADAIALMLPHDSAPVARAVADYQGPVGQAHPSAHASLKRRGP